MSGFFDRLAKDEYIKLDDSKENVICPSCDSLVFAFEKDTIKLKKFPVECSNCGDEFFYKIGKGKKYKLKVV